MKATGMFSFTSASLRILKHLVPAENGALIHHYLVLKYYFEKY